MNLAKLVVMFRALRAGAPLGDVVVLKVDALTREPNALAQRLEPVRGFAPEHDLAALRRLANGTLGREYARFLDDNHIKQLVISPAVRARFADRPYALRYTTTHDLHHVLTGFDTGLAGELGVLAFNVGQGSAPVSRFLFRIGCWIYSLLAPSELGRIRHNVRVGLAAGARAELVIAAPIESSFDQRLDVVRAKLNVPDPRKSGVLASGDSLLGRLLYPASKGA